MANSTIVRPESGQESWYTEDVTAAAIPLEARELLEQYSKIPPDEVVPHILEVVSSKSLHINNFAFPPPMQFALTSENTHCLIAVQSLRRLRLRLHRPTPLPKYQVSLTPLLLSSLGPPPRRRDVPRCRLLLRPRAALPRPRRHPVYAAPRLRFRAALPGLRIRSLPRSGSLQGHAPYWRCARRAGRHGMWRSGHARRQDGRRFRVLILASLGLGGYESRGEAARSFHGEEARHGGIGPAAGQLDGGEPEHANASKVALST